MFFQSQPFRDCESEVHALTIDQPFMHYVYILQSEVDGRRY